MEKSDLTWKKKKKKKTMIKPLNKQTNKGKKGRNLWLIKLLFYNEKILNIFFKVFLFVPGEKLL